MNKNINCIYDDSGSWCKNENVPKSLFGIGARLCKEFDSCSDCEFKVKHNRPSPPTAPPKPTCHKVSGYEGDTLK
jgi:hypothetical protein